MLVLAACNGARRRARSAWGYRPVTNLSHARVSALHTLGLSFAALGVFALPLIAVAAFAILLSS